MRRTWSVIISVGIHLGILTLAFWGVHKKAAISLKEQRQVLLELDPTTARGPIRGSAPVGHAKNHEGKQIARHHSVDLRPGFAKNPFFSKGLDSPSGSEARESSGAQTRDLLVIEGKAMQAFDQLAELIDGQLDYPDLLVENGVQGVATLDLYFDQNAQVDESRTRISGDNRWVRGLLVQAGRKGLVDWYKSRGGRLEKEKFKNQHFRADFVITYVLTEPAQLEKSGEGYYRLTRRRLRQTCLSPLAGGVDLACAAMKLAGAVKNTVSAHYKQKFEILTDRLDAMDAQGLKGINAELERRS